MAQAGIELRTPASIFNTIEQEFEHGGRPGRNPNRDGSVLAGLGLRTSTDIAEEFEREEEQARIEGSSRGQRTQTPSAMPGAMPRATSSSEVTDSTEHGPSETSPSVVANRSYLGQRRSGPAISRKTPSKRVRRADRLDWNKEEQRRELDGIMRGLDDEFVEKERLSYDQAWCAPILTRTKVNTV
ncbi:hypothetical protein P152DRAFT_476221 [Eremomyces bilateralis CBS 781.70]|uniref:Uncharacterized protein n=1 Tax=Eremomyces bilateralis CBS 781.70 TaxID=1392243 RepID=A0A6G1FW20_9PEZI|nr:uncharacterized protein P152DRAFT_476221 [Eremomyces bilateralis CBS 781.70]KAF1809819.1 hypothetical protein P152DRAFT_476221 [Eremomyces bilateralis CBS 781.70]